MPHTLKKKKKKSNESSGQFLPLQQRKAGGPGQSCQSWTPRGHLRSSGQQRVPVASSGQSGAQDRANIPEVAPPRGGGQGPGLAWHPRRGTAALAAWPAREGARPPRAEQGRREPAARPRPGIWRPSPRPGRRRPAQRLSGSAGTRRRALPWTPPGSTTRGNRGRGPGERALSWARRARGANP